MLLVYDYSLFKDFKKISTGHFKVQIYSMAICQPIFVRLKKSVPLIEKDISFLYLLAYSPLPLMPKLFFHLDLSNNDCTSPTGNIYLYNTRIILHDQHDQQIGTCYIKKSSLENSNRLIYFARLVGNLIWKKLFI